MLDEEPKTQAFRIGDMQEHRYPFAKAWKQNSWPAVETDHLENIGKIVNEHWDPKKQVFKSHWQVLHDREEAENKAREESEKKGGFQLPRNIINDWTGQRFLEPCLGAYPCPPKYSNLQLESEVQNDPFDPDYADVNKIIKRYKEQDAKEELYNNRMALGQDPHGGLDKIAAACA